MDDDFNATQARRLLDDAERIGTRLGPDSRILYGAWGLAWLLGYGTLWASAPDGQPPPTWAFVVFAGSLASAGVVTAVHIARRSGGVRGTTAATGTMYGLTWPIAFAATGIMLGALSQAGLTGEQMALVSNGFTVLVVGALYMAGGAMYRDRAWFALGAWITLVVAVATLLGVPHLFLVMCLAGGGVMLVVALVQHIQMRRVSR